ncbi:methyl-accepting chemotaxis protein [Seleniivibrio woodruffii]|uniref:Methyl-accepting chemotaxis protein n=1 Tax=Seleniivibrio woodruffii TaxID=1078050 RepID=A0A4R1K9H7_9BACT|nr:methyl-accepting chemotaxis protein [Seleniivibrio woodruffii]TCK60513.1 methyl-accepting chemotaxis protein [Seleniivibrio woodruffii]TVZ36141.1 methyl-accepting chemotaxis protein [Seleniivibrio woodruffii]
MGIKIKLIMSYLLVSAFIVVLSLSFIFSSSKVNGFINTNLSSILTDKEASGIINNEFKNVVIALKSAVNSNSIKEIEQYERQTAESFEKINTAVDKVEDSRDISNMSRDLKSKTEKFLKTKKEYIKVHEEMMILFDDMDSFFRRQKGFITVSQAELKKSGGSGLPYLERMMEEPLGIKIYISELMYSEDDVAVEEGIYSLMNYNKALVQKTNTMMSLTNNAFVKERMQLLLKACKELDEAALQMKEIRVNALNLEGSLFTQIKDMEKTVAETEALLTKLEASASKQMDTGIKEVNSISSKVTSTTFVMVGVILILAVIVGIFSATKITTPLVSIMKVSECIKQGDLTCADIPKTSQDEFGELTDSINSMKGNLYELVQNIKNGTDYLNTTSDQTVTMMKQMHENLNSTSIEMASVASAAEELSASTSNIIDSVENGISEVNSAKKMVVEGNSRLQQSIGQVNSVAANLAGVSANLTDLKNASQQITNIVSIIVDIAEQTNLLALNAAIEAARAGEAGRGFAVVADEVRKLAEKTSTSTQEISGMVGTIQSNVTDVVNRINSGIDEVKQSSDSINYVGEGFAEAVSQMQRAAASVEPILTIIEQQSEAITNITSTVTNVSIASADNKVIVDEVSEFSNRIGDLAHQLKDNTARFKV